MQTERSNWGKRRMSKRPSLLNKIIKTESGFFYCNLCSLCCLQITFLIKHKQRYLLSPQFFCIQDLIWSENEKNKCMHNSWSWVAISHIYSTLWQSEVKELFPGKSRILDGRYIIRHISWIWIFPNFINSKHREKLFLLIIRAYWVIKY